MAQIIFTRLFHTACHFSFLTYLLARVISIPLNDFFIYHADVRYFSCKQKLRCRRPRLDICAHGRFGWSIRDRRHSSGWAKCKVSTRPPIRKIFLTFFLSLLCITQRWLMSKCFHWIYHVWIKNTKN